MKMDIKRAGLEKGFNMSQHEVAVMMGLNQRTISKAECSMLKKLKAILSKHEVSATEFFTYLKYQEL